MNEPADAMNASRHQRRMGLALLVFIVATLAIPAIGFGTGAAIEHHEAVQLVAENEIPSGGVCPGWQWHWVAFPTNTCTISTTPARFSTQVWVLLLSRSAYPRS